MSRHSRLPIAATISFKTTCPTCERLQRSSNGRFSPYRNQEKCFEIASRRDRVSRPDSCRYIRRRAVGVRSEEDTSELQSLMRISYAVVCCQKKKKKENHINM